MVGVSAEGWVVSSFEVCAAWDAEDGGGGEFPQFGSWDSVAAGYMLPVLGSGSGGPRSIEWRGCKLSLSFALQAGAYGGVVFCRDVINEVSVTGAVFQVERDFF